MIFKYKDISLYYEKKGIGKEELVILPGWGDTRPSWNFLINLLADYYTIYTVDYPGFGNTSFPSHDLTIYDYTELINAWLQSLELTNPTLLGHSFGGRILIALTGYYQYPYKKLILMNAAGIKPKKTFKAKMRTMCYKFLRKLTKIFPKKIQKKWQEKLFSHFSSEDYKLLPISMRKTFQNIVNEDLSIYLKNIQAETLILWGNNDTSTPIHDAYLMKKEIPNASLISFKNSGHFLYLEKFQQTLEQIVKFVEKE